MPSVDKHSKPFLKLRIFCCQFIRIDEGDVIVVNMLQIVEREEEVFQNTHSSLASTNNNNPTVDIYPGKAAQSWGWYVESKMWVWSKAMVW